ncbi:SA1362 family protein [Virgibacillus sp. C22-A2]|uniref:SA1362 family protein n=1 Tax=Virgibacillus tibetensis TaxID=3042313 RepID=A0ABU6KAB5_9BACI|nr:SA1362 family protein [Virgibacillus sp. C22-A2]
MNRRRLPIVLYIIIGLAVIGLFSQLFTNTIGFLTNIIVMIAVGIAIFSVIYFVFLKNRAPSNDMKKYKQAVKQSKSKYQQHSHSVPSTSKSIVLNKKKPKKKINKRAPHLRVIDGNKKGKDRATF